jgi:hypothetical protein
MKTFLVAFGGAAIGAGAVLAFHSWHDRSSSPSAAAMGATDVGAITQLVQKETAALRDQLDQARRDLEELRSKPEPARVEVAPTPHADADSSAARIEALKERVDALEKKAERSAPAVVAFGPVTPEAKAATLRESTRIATDRAASEKDRRAALSQLRGMQTDDGKDARTHDVVLAMVEIAENSADEESRLDVYRNLHNSDDSAVKDSMVRALQKDASAKVREKVAQDVDCYLDDPLVESALQNAANSDADASVRNRALETLGKKERMLAEKRKKKGSP